MRPTAALAASALITGCGAGTLHPSTPSEPTAAGSPLGPSYILVPLPNDDDALLGRVLLDVPENGRSLDEVSRPNECADKLTPKKEGPLASTFEDGQELAAGGKARAALGAFGFEGDAQTATHFYYKLDVSKRVAQTDTTEYVACCKDKGSCGYGFVSALIYGDGQYATAAETNAEASVSIPVAGGAGGFVSAKILHKRNVHGFVAALVTVTDQAKAKSISVLGDPAAAGITLTEQNLPDQVKERFELAKIQVESQGGGPQETAYVFRDGNGDVTENEFVRRYRALTNDRSLDDAEQNRHSASLVASLVLLPMGVAGLATGPLVGLKDSSGNPNGGGIALTSLGLTAVVGGTVLLIEGTSKYDGTAAEHVVTKFDADLYAAKYNRALLRKTVQDTKERMQQLSSKNDGPALRLSPVISPTFTGVVGQF